MFCFLEYFQNIALCLVANCFLCCLCARPPGVTWFWYRSRFGGDGWEIGAGSLISGVRSLKAGKSVLPVLYASLNAP